MIRLTFVCTASTAATRRAAFPLDEPLDKFGAAEARALSLIPAFRTPPQHALTSPALRARQTAELLRVDATPDAALRDLDYGRWSGKTMAEIGAAEQDAVAAWLSDPSAAPHGGESIAALFDRVRGFLGGLGDGTTVAVTHVPVIRAAVAIVLDAPLSSFWKIDIAPLARAALHGEAGRWRLRSISD
ncbi:MAG: histidine phosphatase family protein [Bauldia sp.]